MPTIGLAMLSIVIASIPTLIYLTIKKEYGRGLGLYGYVVMTALNKIFHKKEKWIGD